MHGTVTTCNECAARRAGICDVLSLEACGELSKIAKPRRVKAGYPIFHDGDPADRYYNIIGGIVKLIKTLADGKQHIIGLLFPADFLGQTLRPVHTFSAEAATDLELCSYPRAAFEAFMARHPEFERRIFEMTVRELDICRDWTLLLGRKCSYERVAGFLLMLSRRVSDRPSPNSARLELPFTRAEMADYLGLTLETVSRQFSRLKRKKVIVLTGCRLITIPDLELLSAVANIESCVSMPAPSRELAVGAP